MKRLFLFALILSFIVYPISAEYIDLKLSYPNNVEKGKEIAITLEIINQSNDRLWDGTIMIEESFMGEYKAYIKSIRDYQNNPFKFSIIEPGQSIKETFVLTFTEDIPLKQAKFNILLKCGKGACRGGCRPFYLEKPVSITLIEERVEAVLKLDTNDFTAYKGETLEVPFILENIGNIQMQDIRVEIKGDILSDEILNIGYLTPGKEISDKIFVSIGENSSKKSLNSIIVARFQDSAGKEGMAYADIRITVIEKEKVEESNTPEVNQEAIKEVKNQLPKLFYFFLFLSIIAIIAVIIFLAYLFKR
ncbi:MAG: hypothetical protein WCY18_03175 [Methanofastidiosum sp.]